jgi:hydroxymethylglutaryl-CoA reductase
MPIFDCSFGLKPTSKSLHGEDLIGNLLYTKNDITEYKVKKTTEQHTKVKKRQNTIQRYRKKTTEQHTKVKTDGKAYKGKTFLDTSH